MFIIFAAAFQLSTTITQDSKLPILERDKVNSWFVDTSKQAFVDWEGNRVRQFHTSNDNSYPINVTLIVKSNFYPFIQESIASNLPKVDEITYTLYPKQHYKVAIEYNCSKQESPAQIELIIIEQSFKNNPNQLDELKQTQLRYFKYCKNPSTPLIDYHTLVIIISVFITTLLSALLCVKKSYTQFDFIPIKQVIALIILPALGAFVYYPYVISYVFAIIVLYDFTYCRSQSHIVSLIISLFGTNIQFYWDSNLIQYLISFVLLVQVNKRIVIGNRIQLFVFFVLIWLTEIYWLVHITQVDKHLLTQSSDESQQFFKTSISLSKQDSEWQLKHIEIHLHQLLALTLIQSFIFRHGLFNKDHIINITFVSIAQFSGFIVFDILYRSKYNPPFLTLITGFILIALAINYIRTGKGLRNPYIEFEEIDDKIKL